MLPTSDEIPISEQQNDAVEMSLPKVQLNTENLVCHFLIALYDIVPNLGSLFKFPNYELLSDSDTGFGGFRCSSFS